VDAHRSSLLALGTCALAPALVYVALLPDYRPLLDKCGKLATMSDPHHGLLKIPTAHPIRAVVLFEDPLCPTCKAFHERLVDEGIFEQLDVTMAMFPLDSDCNWMLDAIAASRRLRTGKGRHLRREPEGAGDPRVGVRSAGSLARARQARSRSRSPRRSRSDGVVR
jgi:hypothetical protein